MDRRDLVARCGRTAAGLALFALFGGGTRVGAQAAGWPSLRRYEPMVVPADNPMTAAKVELGRQLFFDRRLSSDGATACVSCHRPEHGFSDGGLAAATRPGRACPTLWNVGYQQALFWEGSAPTLERAVLGMWRFNLAPGKDGQAGCADVAAQLGRIDGYREQFEKSFGEAPTVENIGKAMAAFLRTLVANRSAWVRFQDGDREALSTRARRGWAVFSGKAACTNCHNGLLLTDLQFHNVGVGAGGEKPQPGRWVITRVERDRGAFKTPSLLDVARSAPYFHDGSVPTLEQAVDLMAGGGIPNPHLDAALASVRLSRAERSSLLAFLRELDVELDGRKPALPQ